MANELQYYGMVATQSGFTVVARVYDAAGGQIGGDVPCPEVGALAIYIGDMPTAAEGVYGVRFFNGVDQLGHGQVDWTGTGERVTATAAEVAAAVPTAADIESALLDDNDGHALIAAIVAAVNTSLDIPAGEEAEIATAVRTALATELGRIDMPVSSVVAGGSSNDDLADLIRRSGLNMPTI